MPAAPVPSPTPQVAPTTPAAAPSPGGIAKPNIKDPKSWYRPGDSENTKHAINEYVATLNAGKGGLAQELSYISAVYGPGVADLIGQRAPEMQAAAKGLPPPTPPAPIPTSATTATGEVVTDITAQDLVDANPSYAGNLAGAQKVLDVAKNDPAYMAQLRATVVTAKNQFFLSLAGVTPSYADKRVQLAPTPTPAPFTGGIFGRVGAAMTNVTQAAAQSTTFANALAAPRAAGYDVTGLQRRLNAAGILPDGTYTPGQYDPATISAYSKVIQAASEMTIPISTRLDQMVANPTLQTPIAPQTRASPADVTNYIMTTFRNAAGRGPTPEEMSKFTADYRMFEDKQYQSTVQQARGATQAAGGNIYNYDPVKDVAAEIAQGMPAQSYVGQDWVGVINKLLGK